MQQRYDTSLKSRWHTSPARNITFSVISSVAFSSWEECTGEWDVEYLHVYVLGEDYITKRWTEHSLFCGADSSGYIYVAGVEIPIQIGGPYDMQPCAEIRNYRYRYKYLSASLA